MINNRKQTIAERLKAIAPHWSQAQRTGWAYRNEVSLATVNRYLAGNIGSIPLAEAILSEAEKYAPGKQIAKTS